MHLGWPYTAWLIVSLNYTRLWFMWSVWWVFCDCGFHSVCLLMNTDRRILELGKGKIRIVESQSWGIRQGLEKVLVAQSCPTLCDPMDCSLPGSCPWNFPGKNTEVGSIPFLLNLMLLFGFSLLLWWWSIVFLLSLYTVILLFRICIVIIMEMLVWNENEQDLKTVLIIHLLESKFWVLVSPTDVLCFFYY